MSQSIARTLRNVFGAAALTCAALGPAHAQAADAFSTIRQIDAGVLNVGYVDAGPANGPVVILLHGWPYDIHSYVDVVPLLTKAGYRVIVPTCAATARPASSIRRPCATANRPHWRRTSST